MFFFPINLKGRGPEGAVVHPDVQLAVADVGVPPLDAVQLAVADVGVPPLDAVAVQRDDGNFF